MLPSQSSSKPIVAKQVSFAGGVLLDRVLEQRCQGYLKAFCTTMWLSAPARGCRSRNGRGCRTPAGSDPHPGCAPLSTRSVGCFRETTGRKVSSKLVIDKNSSPCSGKVNCATVVFDGVLLRALRALGALVRAVKMLIERLYAPKIGAHIATLLSLRRCAKKWRVQA